MMWIWSLVGFELGTQPGTLTTPIDTVAHCETCHAGFANSPIDAWEGTMMANALDDPLFLAGLTIANQDIPGIGDFCLRCHTPPGWLEGRCAPGDTSSLIPTDFEGVQCDFCHRMTASPSGPQIGNAVYTVSNDDAKRNTSTGAADHDVVVDPLFATSELCGVCHEVSNPLFGDFPIERTFSEWAASAFAEPGGQTCQDCHMPAEVGYAAAGVGVPSRTIHVHRFVGGNTFIPRILAGERPDLGRAEAFLATEEAARELLHQSATVTVETSALFRGEAGTVYVKVENLGGHKLPTGYPEGRRAWLDVTVTDVDGTILVRSGEYDPVQARLVADAALRTYEAKLGTGGVPSYHMVQQDEILFDSRIPPRGFRPTPDLEPVGRTYETLPDGSVAPYDRAPYLFEVPSSAEGPLTIEAKLWYQTTTREFIEFLRDENVTDDAGQVMYDLWVAYDRDPPELLAEATGTILLFDPAEEPEDEEVMCGCAYPGPSLAWLAAPLVWSVRRRIRPR